jgi:hypothetical protein
MSVSDSGELPTRPGLTQIVPARAPARPALRLSVGHLYDILGRFQTA